MIGVYQIRNRADGKRYVGSSIRVEYRWETHVSKLHAERHHSPHLQAAWLKYGANSFEFLILEECEASEILTREQYWLDRYEAYKPVNGYNTALTAEAPMMGRRHSEASKKKMSESLKARWAIQKHPRLGTTQTAEARLKIGLASKERWKNQPHPMLGKPRSEETKAKIRGSKAEYYLTHESPRKGCKLTPEQKAKLQEGRLKWYQENDHPMLGKTHTPEAKRRIGEAGKGRIPWNKGIPLTEEVKAKLSKTMTGRTASEDTKAKLRTATRGENNPSAKLSETQVFQILDEYASAKISQAKLGAKFGVTQALVNLIVNGKSWTHVYEQFHSETLNG